MGDRREDASDVWKEVGDMKQQAYMMYQEGHFEPYLSGLAVFLLVVFRRGSKSCAVAETPKAKKATAKPAAGGRSRLGWHRPPLLLRG